MLVLPPFVVQLALLALVLTAAAWDVRYRRIPNWLTVGGVAAGIGINWALHAPVAGLVYALKGLGLAFGLYFVLYALHAMGAGDVKLMAAVGALAGWRNWLGIFLFTALLGGVAALILVIYRKRLRRTLWNVGFIFSEMTNARPAYLKNEELDVKSSKALRMPHGATIAVATTWFLALGAYLTR